MAAGLKGMAPVALVVPAADQPATARGDGAWRGQGGRVGVTMIRDPSGPDRGGENGRFPAATRGPRLNDGSPGPVPVGAIPANAANRVAAMARAAADRLDRVNPAGR